MTLAKASQSLAAAIETNKKAATSAALFETGRLANKALVNMVSPKMPIMVRGYVNTPIGKLVLANMVKLAIDQFRPDNQTAHRLANGMIVAAYTDAIQSFDIEGILDDLLSDSKILKSLAKSDTDE